MEKRNKIVVIGTALLMLLIIGLVVWFYLIPELDKRKVTKVVLTDDQKLSATLRDMAETYFKNNDLYDTDNLAFLKLDTVQYLGKKDNILTYYLNFKTRCKKSKDVSCLYVSKVEDIDYTKRFDYSGFAYIKEENGYYTLLEFNENIEVPSDTIFAQNLVADSFENNMKLQYDFDLFEIESVKFLYYAKLPIYEIKGTFRCNNTNKQCLVTSINNSNFDYIVGTRKEADKNLIDFIDETTNYDIIK